MADMLSSVGTFLSSPSAKGVTALAGLGSGIAGTIDNALQQSQYNKTQSYIRNLVSNPAAYNAYVQQYVQPLNQGLVTGVENQTNAQLAERGLGSSGAITQSVLAQALAPYIQQNQQQAQSIAQQNLGILGGQKPNANNPFTDVSKLLAGLTGKGGGGSAQSIQSLLASSPSITTSTDPSAYGGMIDPVAMPDFSFGG